MTQKALIRNMLVISSNFVTVNSYQNVACLKGTFSSCATWTFQKKSIQSFDRVKSQNYSADTVAYLSVVGFKHLASFL